MTYPAAEKAASKNYFVDGAISFCKLVGEAGKELAFGVWYRKVPLAPCLFVGILGCICLIGQWDYLIFKKFYIGKLYPTNSKVFFAYWLIIVTSGFWGWGMAQAGRRNRLSRKLKDIFTEAGLKSSIGRIPMLVFDTALDEYTRKLRVTVSGATLDKFKDARNIIESNMKIHIDDIREDRRNGMIDIVYSSEPMPEKCTISDFKAIPPCKFVVGETRSKIIKADIRDVPHLLVAGQTGGGKSTFLRQFILTHYLNLPGSRFTLIDLKEGLESQMFENVKRIHAYSDVAGAIGRLRDFGDILESRMKLLKQNNCKDLEQYIKKQKKASKEGSGESNEHLGRHFIVVDEAAELFLAGGSSKSADVQTARKILSQVARQGRSSGVHLVIATQRPDSRALDPQVKANLPGVLCFQMANDASSITVLGNGRATDLAPIRGRAIWKAGAEMVEIQTPLVDSNRVEILLKPFKRDEKSAATKDASKTKLPVSSQEPIPLGPMA